MVGVQVKRGSSATGKTLKKYREDLENDGVAVPKTTSLLSGVWKVKKGEVTHDPLSTMLASSDRGVKNLFKDNMKRKNDVEVLDQRTMDLINSLSVKEMASLLGKDAQDDIAVSAAKRTQTSHWDEQSEEMLRMLHEQARLWMEQHDGSPNERNHQRERHISNAEMELELINRALITPGELSKLRQRDTTHVIDDMVVEYAHSAAALTRFRRSTWQAPSPSGAFMRPSFPLIDTQVRRVPDELEAFRKRMFQLMGKIGDPSEVETTSALRKWFKKTTEREKEKMYLGLDSVLTAEQMIEKRIFNSNMDRGWIASAPVSGVRSTTPLVRSVVAGEKLGAQNIASARSGTLRSSTIAFAAVDAAEPAQGGGAVQQDRHEFIRTWAHGLAGRPERPKTAPAAGRMTRTLFGAPAQDLSFDEIRRKYTPRGKGGPGGSGAASGMTTRQQSPRGPHSPVADELVVEGFTATDHSNLSEAHAAPQRHGRDDQVTTAVSFLLSSPPPRTAARPRTAPARRPAPEGKEWFIAQVSSPPTSPRGEDRARGTPRVGDAAPKVVLAQAGELGGGGYGYIAPHGGWASSKVVSPRGRPTSAKACGGGGARGFLAVSPQGGASPGQFSPQRPSSARPASAGRPVKAAEQSAASRQRPNTATTSRGLN